MQKIMQKIMQKNYAKKQAKNNAQKLCTTIMHMFICGCSVKDQKEEEEVRGNTEWQR